MRKKIISTVLGVALIMGAFVGVSRFLPKQETIVIEPNRAAASPVAVETVKDAPLSKTDKSPFTLAAKGAVLIDAFTGQVLFEQDAHKELPLASVTKVMTMLLVMEAVHDGRIAMNDKVTISERAASMGGSQMFMEVGEQHTVEELLEGVAMASANDGCVALSEHVAGSEEIFVERMNDRAAALGMRDTHFVNTNGLPVADHYSSAYDIAVMSQKLYAFEETHKWFTTWQSTITVGLPGKEKEFGLTNTNKLIKQYEGCNGIKTGFTSEAGYCLSASAIRGQTHLIAVALGCETAKSRNAEISKLLDYGFANYETVCLAEKGQVMEKLVVEKGTPQRVEAVTQSDITTLVPKGEKNTVTCKVKMDEKVTLPLKKGAKIGEVKVMAGKKEIAAYPLLASVAVEKASFTDLVKRLLTYR